MKANVYMLSAFAIMVLFIGVASSGCTGTKTNTGTSPFVGGTNGLLINFVENSPPSEVFDSGGYPFNIMVKIENAGEYTVEKDKVKVSISGISPQDFGLVSGSSLIQTAPDNLEKMSIGPSNEKIPGTITFVEFQELNYKDTLPGSIQVPIRADVCYQYGTKGLTMACIRKDILSTKEGVCAINDPKTIYSSGAPIQVISFEERIAGGNKITFTFKIAQKGNGNVYKFGTGCEPSITNENRVKVKINSELTGLTCNNLREGTGTTEGYARLNNGEAIITCVQPISADSVDALIPITIDLTYDYEEQKTTQLVIKHFS